jgi:hypothetical protein
VIKTVSIDRRGNGPKREKGEHRLTLDEVPDALLAAYGFERGLVAQAHFRCSEAGAMLLPIELVRAPQRRLSEEGLRSVLQGVRDAADFPACTAARDGDQGPAELIDGMHRYAVSVALGFGLLPCLILSVQEAREHGLLDRWA